MNHLPKWMTSLAVGWLAALGILVTDRAAMAGDPTASPASQTTNVAAFSQFQLILRNNIFDPDRGVGTTLRKAALTRPPRVETFSFRGAAEKVGKGCDGFFTGDGAPASGILDVNDMINGFKIQEINLRQVKLADTNHQVLTLEVQTGLARQDEGPWIKIPAPALYTSNRKTGL
ncbi:MAG: hypothetical protein ABSA47_13190 [Verrucomicrobiota bacterium]|jgi:hypothetical protein